MVEQQSAGLRLSDEFKKEVEQFKIYLKPPVQKVSDSANVYVVRHGLSEFNYEILKAEHNFTKDSDEFRSC